MIQTNGPLVSTLYCVFYPQIEEYPMMKLYQNGEDVAIYRGDWSLGAFTEFLEFLTEELGKTEHEHEEL